MNGNRITGLITSQLPASSSDARCWSQVVNLVRDSERNIASKVSKTGIFMTGDLKYDDNNRVLGCTDLSLGKTFSIVLGDILNRLYLILRDPVIMKTTHGFLVEKG